MPNAQNIFLISITPTVELNSYVSRCSRSRWTFEKIFVNKQHSRQTWSVRVENSFKMFITLRFWVQFISFYACLKERCPNLLIWLFKFIWINARFCRAIAANPKFDSRKANFGGLRPYLVKILTKKEKRRYNKQYCQFNSSHISRVFHKKNWRNFILCRKFIGRFLRGQPLN